MRILYVVSGLSTGGAELMLFKLLSTLDRARFQAYVVTLRDKGVVGPKIEALGVPVYELGIAGLWSLPRAVWRSFRIIRQSRPMLIQGWMYHGNLVASLLGCLVSNRVPVLWNIRQSLSDLDAEKRLTALVIRTGAGLSGSATRIMYNSHKAARQHEHLGYSGNKAVIIPNGFNTAIFRPNPIAAMALRRELGVGSKVPLIGLVARYHPMKDHENFLRAAALLLQKHPAIRFVMVGRDVVPDNPNLANLIKGLALEGYVYLLGERVDMPEVTAALDVAVNASLRGEAFPNAVGEAMACGIPCVVTDVGDSAWIVGQTGRVVPPCDASAMAAVIGELLCGGAEYRLGLGQAARFRINELFFLEHVVAQYVALYELCVAEGKR